MVLFHFSEGLFVKFELLLQLSTVELEGLLQQPILLL